MYPIEVLYLINQMRHRELIRQAEKEQLSQSVLKNNQRYHAFGTKIIKWIRERLTEKGKREKNFYDQQILPNPSCTVSEAKSK